MNILALDPASRTGFAFNNGTHIEVGVWDLTKGEHLDDLRERMLLVDAWIGIKTIAFEDAAFGNSGGRFKMAMQFQNELRGVIRGVAQKLGVPIVAYVPSTIKKFATGNGRAQKWQMVRAAEMFFGLQGIGDDVADARFILEMAIKGYQPPPSAKVRKKAEKAFFKKQARLFR